MGIFALQGKHGCKDNVDKMFDANQNLDNVLVYLICQF